MPVWIRQVSSAYLRRLTHLTAPIRILFLAKTFRNPRIADHIVKGDTLTFLIYHLSLKGSERIQKALQAEIFAGFSLAIDDASTINDQVFSTDTLSKILQFPYLDAVLKETLRVYTAIPVTLPRIVPPSISPSSATRPKSKVPKTSKKNGRYIDGYFLPAGTVVGSFAHGIHRDKDTFMVRNWPGRTHLPGVGDFYPERWLVGEGRDILGLSADCIQHEKERIRAMERRFWAFGSGGRGCVGKQYVLPIVGTATESISNNACLRVIFCEAWPPLR